MNTVSSDGRLQIRANDMKDCVDIQEKLKSMGVEVAEHKENNSKKKFFFLIFWKKQIIFFLNSNYLGVHNLDWKEGNLQIEEKRLDVIF